MSEIELLEGWRNISLGDVIELKYGKSLPQKNRDDEGFPVYGSNGIVGNHSSPLVDKGGIIVGKKGSFGEVQLSKTPFFPIDTTYYVDEVWGQPLKFWFYLLKHLPLTKLNRSTAILGLNREDAYNQPIFLPPLPEQKIIADKLDTLLAQVETTKARLERLPEIIKRFRQSVLAATVSGRLTESWREYNPDKTTKSLLENFTVLKRPPRWKSRSTSFIQGVNATAVGKPKAPLNRSWEWVSLVDVCRMESGHTPSRSKPEYWGGRYLLDWD